MDSPDRYHFEDDVQDGSPRRDEAAVWAVLERSRRDVAKGRTVPLAPVLDRM